MYKFYVESSIDESFIKKLQKDKLSSEEFSISVVNDIEDITALTANEILQGMPPNDIVIAVRTGLKNEFGIVRIFNLAGRIFNLNIDLAYCKDNKDGYQYLYSTLKDILARLGVLL